MTTYKGCIRNTVQKSKRGSRMKKSEVVLMFAKITGAYPGAQGFSTADRINIDTWAENLADIPAETTAAALRAHIATSPYPPKICDIRKWALQNSFMDPGEAWALVVRAIHDYGHNRELQAIASLPEEVGRIAKQMGWRDLCMSENIMADRAHFLKIYQACQERNTRLAALPEVVKNALPSTKPLELEGGQFDKNASTIHHSEALDN